MEETQVIVTNYCVPPSNAKGLQISECACRETVWALPWNDSLAKWTSHQQSPLRAMFEAKGLLRPHPPSAITSSSHRLRTRISYSLDLGGSSLLAVAVGLSGNCNQVCAAFHYIAWPWPARRQCA
jgi:hypothetical protein